MAATSIDHLTLRVHHVVVLKKTLTNPEVIFFDLLLCLLYRLRKHIVFEYFALFESHTIHQRSNTIARKKTHQMVLKRDVENRATGVSLTTGTASQLTVHTARLMTLRTNNGKTTRLFHLGGELNVGTTTCHVGSNGNSAFAPCLSHDVGFSLMQLSIEHVVFDLTQREHSAEQFTNLYRSSTHKHRSPLLYEAYNLFDNSVILLTSRLVDAVVHILAEDGAIRWNNHNIQLVYVPQFSCFCFGSTGHPR